MKQLKLRKMKIFLNLLTLLFCIIILLSFIRISPQNGVEFYELKTNDTIIFKDGPHVNATYKRGSYDKTGYDMYLTNKGGIHIKDRIKCMDKNQSEVIFFNCSGSITRNIDTLKIIAKSNYKYFYIFSIEKNGIVNTLPSNIKLVLVSKTLKNEYCPNLVSTVASLQIVAIPNKVNPKEVYEPIHKDNTIGVFNYFLVTDSTGKSHTYPAGDYVITGGNSLKSRN